jgi:hypothetical protein
MRVMLALTGASPGGEWNDQAEKELPANMLLFDIVAALRSDLTFLMTGRAWLCRTYWQWTHEEDASWKQQPMMRGYLYLSVPRQTLLARTVADGTGKVGDRPALFGPLKDALEAARWSSTLYIAPGIFHQEFGWPYELGFTLQNNAKTFRLDVEGGMILRIAEGALLNGVAFRARGYAVVGGRAGSSRLGASAEARAEFVIQAKLIAYVSARRVADTFFYGLLSLDVAVTLSVRFWLQVKIFRKRIRFEIGFSFGLSLSIALEAVVGATSPYIGARARVSVGVRGFGRQLTIGVGVRFNDGYLTDARARVARFMTLGLGVSTPDPEHGLSTTPAPLPEPSRGERAAQADKRLKDEADRKSTLGGHSLDSELPIEDQDAPEPPSEPAEQQRLNPGDEIQATHYWAIIHPTRPREGTNSATYILQIIPRDELVATHNAPLDNDPAYRAPDRPGTFFASPAKRLSSADSVPQLREFDHRLVANDSIDDLPALVQLTTPRGDDSAPGRSDPLRWEPHAGLAYIETTVNWAATVPQPDPQVTLRIQHVVEGCFLNWKDQRPFTEPTQRKLDLAIASLPSDANASAQTLYDAAQSREALDDLKADSAAVEERRSALIGIVAESAALLATRNSDSTTWPHRDRTNGLDCRDFGLTFEVTEEELGKLFHQPDDGGSFWSARFMIQTAVNRFTGAEGEDGTGATELADLNQMCGDVMLLNPPSQFFERRQPILSRQRKVVIPSGLALDWDLEPAWGSSTSITDDPEYLLRHYRIERRILNAVGVTTRTLTIKPAAPARFSNESAEYTMSLLRPRFQFVDDFADLSPALRAALLRDSLDRHRTDESSVGETPEQAWNRAFQNQDEARIIYSIVPVDIAGTEADATVIEHSIKRPLTRTRPLRQVQLQVSYEHLPEAAKTPRLPELKLTVLDDRPDVQRALREALAGKTSPDEWGPVFVVRVRRDQVLEGGSFGDDHVPPMDRVNADADAEILQSDDLDYVVELSAVPSGHERIWVQYRVLRGDGSIYFFPPLAARIYPAERRNEDVAHLQLEPRPATLEQISFSQALGLHGSNRAVVSSRLFARPFVRDSVPAQRVGLWRMVDLTLQVKVPAGSNILLREPVVDVQVERLERPAKASFRALHRSDMHASAGRLHRLYPKDKSHLAEFLDDPTAAWIVFRDPMRRSAIRLAWSAHPTELTYAGTTQEPPRGMIGGFDLFNWNPDALPHAQTVTQSTLEDVPRHAQYLGRIGVLPHSLRGLVPSEVGEMSRVEASYPSESWRLEVAKQSAATNGMRSNARRRRWFSPAESMLMWPEKMLRRQLLPLPDEMHITTCFSRGMPDSIEASIIMSGAAKLPILQPSATTWPPEPGTMPDHPVDSLRNWLRDLIWIPAAGGDASSYDRAFARNPAAFNDCKLSLKIKRGASEPQGVEIPLQFDGRHHALIEELLAEIRYKHHDGTTYRRYEPVVENVPKLGTLDWLGFLDETVTSSDPYGWGVLRQFGLAAGFRLYDTEDGEFLSGKDAASFTRRALSKVINRYRKECLQGQLGAPFVELIAHPSALLQVSSYDGADPPPNGSRVLEELCSFVQLSLRPAPQRLIDPRLSTSTRAATHAIHYVQLSFMSEPIATDEIDLSFFRPLKREDGTVQIAGLLIDLDFATGAVANRPSALLSTRLGEQGMTVPDGAVSNLPVLPPLSAKEITSSAIEYKDKPLALARITVVGAGIDLMTSELERILRRSADNEKPILPACLSVKWLQHSTEPSIDGHHPSDEPFERFADLPAEVLAIQLCGIDKVPAFVAWRKLYETLASWGSGLKHSLPERKSETEIDTPEKLLKAWLEIANRLPAWSRRFLEHNLVAPLEFDDAQLRIPFALATIPQPDPWRVPVDKAGRCEVLLLEKDRFGKRLRYACRPFGRYTAFEEAEKRTVQANEDFVAGTDVVGASSSPASLAPTLEGALDAPATCPEFEPWIEVNLPRTEQVATPVILSARRVDESNGASGRRLELVIARPADETLADANTAIEAAVNSLGLGLEFHRQYNASLWTERLGKTLEWKIEPLEAITPQRPTTAPPPVDWSGSSDLKSLRESVPELWRGAVIYNFADLPYFYRTHVLVHAAAGVVVSDHAVATFTEGPCRLRMPTAGDVTRRDPTKELQPRWHIAIVGSARVLKVRIPLVRFVDCMLQEQIDNWTRASIVPRTFYVPDPAVHYRLSLATDPDTGANGAAPKYASIASEVELLPVDPEVAVTDTPSFYFSKQVGHHLAPLPTDLEPLADNSHDPNQLFLDVELVSARDAPAEILPYQWPAPWNTPSQWETLTLDPAQIGALCLHLPANSMKLCVDRFTANNIKTLPAQALPLISRIDQMLAAVPADAINGAWWPKLKQSIEKSRSLLERLGTLHPEGPEGQWEALLQADLGGAVSGQSYELLIDLPAGNLLQLVATGELRLLTITGAWVMPEDPPDDYDARQLIDAELAKPNANGVPHVDDISRRAIRKSLRDRRVARRRMEYERPIRGFAALRATPEKQFSPEALDLIEEQTFDALHVVNIVIPQQPEALAALLLAIDRIPSATDALEQLGAIEDNDPDKPSGPISLTVPRRHLSSIPGIGDGQPHFSIYVLRRPATKQELDQLIDPDLRALIKRLTEEQVFGAQRRLVLHVFRALDTPIHRTVNPI